MIYLGARMSNKHISMKGFNKLLKQRRKCLNCYYFFSSFTISGKMGYLCCYDFVAKTRKEMKEIKNCIHYKENKNGN